MANKDIDVVDPGASCSSCAPISPKIYDVFISFRGEDTRTNFTSHLCEALRRNKIEIYVDDRLEKGDEVWPSLEKAIEDSTLFLVIFSENYASSTWCLNELSKILECTKDQGHLVMPVFYKVDPSQVRKQLGSFQIAFAEYEHNSNRDQVPKWRRALTQAANLAGWHCSYDRNEAELINAIVNEVMTKVDHMCQGCQDDLQGLVGIQKRIAKVESLLNNGSQDVRFIGIWGMGGIGKTTLAKAVFKKWCFAYEGFCFLENVREESERHGINHLKKILISTLLGEKESHLGMPDGVAPNAMRRLTRKKVLVVLDDVDDQEQLEILAGRQSWFGLRSRILITTRDKQTLSKDINDIYAIEALNYNESFCLFSLNAAKSDCLDMELIKLARNMVNYAKGIPLALKVLASLLYGKGREEWESQLEKLKRMPCKKIQHVLRLSYDGLDDEEKNIFLDIACFLKESNVEGITNLLDAYGYSTSIGLKNLEDKCLVTISEERRVLMHDLIQEMGRGIVREESWKNPGKRSRLWDPYDIFQVLKNNTGTEAIEGITLNILEVDELHISNPQTFCSMYNLKFLDFHKSKIDQANRLHFPCGLEFLPNNLRFLRFHEYPSKSLPTTFSTEKLVTMDLRNSNLERLWDGDQNLANLKEINLKQSKCLIELPNFSKAVKLKSVMLRSCTSLRCVHPSILSLQSLEHLELSNCTALTSLTSNTHLKSLSHLSLNGCSKLREFSVTSGTKLSLYLAKTSVNDEWSSPRWHLNKIGYLGLNDCTSLTNLPYKLADFNDLESLSIKRCNKLASNLHFLFDLSHSLQYLDLDYCDFFELPDIIEHLSRLKWLSLQGCYKLRSIPKLPPSILFLCAINCISLETLQFIPLATRAILEKDHNTVRFDFLNCQNLDQQSIKAVEAKALLGMNEIVSAIENGYIYWGRMTELIYPGSRVPEWFMYRTTQSSIILGLDSLPHSQEWSFIICVIVSGPTSLEWLDIAYNVRINGQEVQVGTYLCFTDDISSDHVFLLHYPNIHSQVQRKIEELGIDGQRTTSDQLVEIEFKVNPLETNDVVIKEFGVCPTYALGYQNYIKQIGMGFGFSYANTDENKGVWDDDLELIPSTKRLKQ